jgi:high-affinity Fe2+/Pb2+ permease
LFSFERKNTMSQSNLSDGAADGLAAVIIVSVVVAWVVFWLGGMPA